MCVQYIRGCSVHQGGCSVHWRDSMMHVGGYHEYIWGCSVHWGFQYKSKAFVNSKTKMTQECFFKLKDVVHWM